MTNISKLPEVSFSIEGGEIKVGQLERIMSSLDSFLRPHLSIFYEGHQIFYLEKFGYKINETPLDELNTIEYFFKRIKENPKRLEIPDYVVYAHRLNFDYGLGTLDMILTNSKEYLNKTRYNKDNSKFLKLNSLFPKESEDPANIIMMPSKDFNKEFFYKIKKKTTQIIERELDGYNYFKPEQSAEKELEICNCFQTELKEYQKN